jgi:hypothetical protein
MFLGTLVRGVHWFCMTGVMGEDDADKIVGKVQIKNKKLDEVRNWTLGILPINCNKVEKMISSGFCSNVCEDWVDDELEISHEICLL